MTGAESAGWGQHSIVVASLPHELKNVEANTGMLLWDAGHALAQLLLACPHLLQGEAASDNDTFRCVSTQCQGSCTASILQAPLALTAGSAGCLAWQQGAGGRLNCIHVVFGHVANTRSPVCSSHSTGVGDRGTSVQGSAWWSLGVGATPWWPWPACAAAAALWPQTAALAPWGSWHATLLLIAGAHPYSRCEPTMVMFVCELLSKARCNAGI